MPDHPLTGKWLVHYYGDRPWRSISDLDEDTANKIAAQTGKIADGTYFKRRCAIETWDRDQHTARGGMARNHNPVYAVLCDTATSCACRQLDRYPGGQRARKSYFPVPWRFFYRL